MSLEHCEERKELRTEVRSLLQNPNSNGGHGHHLAHYSAPADLCHVSALHGQLDRHTLAGGR